MNGDNTSRVQQPLPEDGCQIVATIGPASISSAAALMEAGATAFRLNASHMSVDELHLLASAVREQVPACPLVIDLQGAKMRLGDFVARALHAGDRIRFSLYGAGDALPLPHREVFAAVETGDTLSCIVSPGMP